VYRDKKRTRFDSRSIVRLVIGAALDQQRSLSVRCAGYSPDAEAVAREHDMLLMSLTDGRIWGCHLNGLDCIGWENLDLCGTGKAFKTAKAFKTHVLDYNAARNIFLVSEAMFLAPEFVNRIQHMFVTSMPVKPVCFGAGTEAAPGGLDMAGMAVLQHKTMISMHELGVDLFKGKAAPNAFITAPAGFGKSHLIRNVLVPLAKAKYSAVNVWVTSSTRVSGDQVGGSTLHTKSGLHRGQGSVEDIVENMKVPVKKRWARVKAIILDEVSMCSADFIQLFDGVAKAMKRNTLPFGGVQMIFVGDFGQLAPVPQIERAPNPDCPGETLYRNKAVDYVFTSRAWVRGNIQLYRLTCYRYEAGGELGKFLQAIRCVGKVTDNEYEKLREIALIEDDVISWKDEEAVMLCCRRKDARITDAARLDKLKEVDDDGFDKNFEVTFCAVDRRGALRHVCDDRDEKKNDEEDSDENGSLITDFDVRRSLYASLGASPFLRLRKNAKVLCSHVLDSDVGPGAIGTVMAFRKASDMYMDAELVRKISAPNPLQSTGPNLTVEQLDEDWGAIHGEQRWPMVEVLLKNGSKKLMTVAPRVFTVEDCDGVLLVSQVQIPLMLVYCMTVHRAQGLTLEKVVFKMDGIFAYGQLYTAMSRVRKMGDMRLVGDIKKGVKLQNIAVTEFERGQRWILVDNKPD